MNFIIFICAILGSYLLGSTCSAIIVCQLLKKPDPRTLGSKNPGTTNVLRLYGKFAAALTLLGDVAKGLIPVLLAQLLQLPQMVVALIGLAAFIGHLFPVFFGFKGGKGVATTFGIVFGLNMMLGALATATWILTAIISRYSSLAALIMVMTLPIYCYLLNLSGYVIPLSILSIMVLITHRSNIKRLWYKQERKLGKQ